MAVCYADLLFELAHGSLRLIGEEVVSELRKLGVKTAVA
jgi:hypothetical protein